MATISTSQYLDSTTTRTVGEAWTINSGAVLTMRTDTRLHAYAPAGMLGSLGSLTIVEGEISIDAQNVRWLAYNSGTGNVPALGVTITQGGVSGYLLGVYASAAVGPTAVAAAMPATGFIKFREVTGGTFAAGALTGIGASATGADVVGWLEVVCDQLANITVPRLGKFKTRGNWFDLGVTTGAVGQILQVPTNGGGADTTPIGAWIETGVGTGVYNHYPALTGTANGWAYQHIGMPPGQSDVRQQFVKGLGTGQMQLGENYSITGATYAGTAAATGTYVEQFETLYYVWENNEVIFYGTHYYEIGEQVGIDFPAGGPADGIYTVTDVLGCQCFKIAATGSGVGNTAICRSRLSLTVTASTINVADNVYCDFTTGTAVDGSFVVKGYNTTNSFDIHYPRTAALTVGNVSVYYGITVTTGAVHNLQPGHRIKLTFTTGTGVTGVYTVIAIPTTTTFVVNVPFNGGTGGNCTVDFQIGYVPPAGCKIRIPNIFLRQTSSANRALNLVPHATLASRPEFTTTAAGALDMQYTYGDWYMFFNQAYSLDVRYCATADTFNLSEIATTPYIDDLCIGMAAAQATPPFNAGTLLAGCEFKNITAMRGKVPAANEYCAHFTIISGGTVDNLRCGVIQYLRATSNNTLYALTCDGTVFTNTISINGFINIPYGPNTKLINTDYCDRMTGWQGGYAGYNAIVINNNPIGVVVDGVTQGFNGTIPNQMPNATFMSGNGTDCIFRNFGTAAAPLQGRASFRPYAYGVTYIVSTANLPGCKYQRMYFDQTSLAPITITNNCPEGTYESIFTDQWSSGRATLYTVHESLNPSLKGIGITYQSTGAVSTYGMHFTDTFQRKIGEYGLFMNEPTAKTAGNFTVLAGNPRFNSSGGIVMYVVGDSAEWEDSEFRKGHTGFFGGTAVPIASIDGGTALDYYLIQYQIDTGAGFSGVWKNFSRPALVTCTVGLDTCTVPDASNIAEGDYLQYYTFTTQYPAYGAKVLSKVGNTLTLNKPNFATGTSQRYVFTSLPNETIDPAIGFRMKIRVTTVTTAADALTSVKCRTTCTPASKALCLYPLDVITLTINGLIDGSDVTILVSGTETVLISKEENYGTTYSYVYETPQNIDIAVYKPGYIPTFIRNFALGSTDSSVPITQTPDPSYLD
ncbi:MAG: hypothetical protein JZU65_23765 [Chlorobium sp.]|nr:hypothetical protein [Chlorobium sp.]